MTVVKNHEFSIELNIEDWCVERYDDGPWAQADLVVASGTTFEEALDDAEVFFVGDDGDNCFSTPFDGSYMSTATYEAIERELAALWAREVDRVLRGLL